MSFLKPKEEKNDTVYNLTESIESVLERYNKLKEQDGYCIHFEYDGKVQVVNNQRISVTMRQSVLDAKMLAEQGKGAEEIKGGAILFHVPHRSR